ncbi:MAG: hypothetical protein IKV87_08495, partial [Methanobrevibacter sp.]|nr:hypothetical protein [Methanobrevibacter sp.]
MNYKKSYIILCLLIFLISIAGVSAGNLDDGVISADDSQLLDEGNNDMILSSEDDLALSSDKVLSSSEDDLALSSDKVLSSSEDDVSSNGTASSLSNILSSQDDSTETDDGTFTSLQKKIDKASKGSTITLDRDYKYDDGFPTSGIFIDKDLTIDGQGHTLDGLSKSRIFLLGFSLKENNVIKLKNIHFENGYTKLYGGAIFNFANLTVYNCTFVKNHADCCGGAINSVGYATYKTSVFRNNTADGDAGAIFTLSIKGSLKVLDVNITNETLKGNMDFIYSVTLNASIKYLRENITKCTFTNNIAKGRGGGAVYAFSDIDIKKSNFRSNKAGEHGGAVFACRNLYINDSSFSNNKVPKYGGAVYFKAHEMSGEYVKSKWVSKMNYFTSTIQNSNFTKNSAGKGGAIYAFVQNSSNKTQYAKVSKCTFTDNSASSNRDTYGAVCKNCAYNYLKLTSKSVTIKRSASSLVITATLKKGASAIKGKLVTFKFNGKTYKVKTNNKGIAKLTIGKNILKKLKVG